MGVTTGAISGLVTDTQDEPLPGAVISATHEPTGAEYTTVTRENGRFALHNVRIGGPYEVVVTMTGFKSQRKENLFVKLGEDLFLEFKLQLDSVEETL